MKEVAELRSGQDTKVSSRQYVHPTQQLTDAAVQGQALLRVHARAPIGPADAGKTRHEYVGQRLATC